MLDKLLDDGEAIQAQARMSAWVVAPRLGANLALFAAGLAMLSRGAVGMGIVAIGFAAAGLAWADLDRRCARVWVTDRRVLVQVGWLTTGLADIPLERIESVRVSQGAWGRTLGFGHVGAIGVGGTHAQLLGIEDPWAFRMALERARRDRCERVRAGAA